MKIISNRFAYLAIIFISLLILPTLKHDLGWIGGDNAQYILLAKSLASGLGYKAINFPHEPPYSYSPPLFPLLLTPIVYFFGYNFLFMHLLIVILGILALVFIYIYFSPLLDKNKAILILLLTGINPYFILYLSEIITEIPYLLFSILALYYIDKYIYNRPSENKYLVLSLLFMLATYFIRSIGMLIFLATIIFVFINEQNRLKKKKIIYASMIFLIPVFLWNLRNLLVVRGQEYNFTNYFLSVDVYNSDLGNIDFFIFIKRIITNLIYYIEIIGRIFLPFLISLRQGIGLFVSSFIFIIILIGLFKRIKERKSPLEFYCILYFLAILLWVCVEGFRYIVPLFPFIFFYFLEGISFIIDKSKNIIKSPNFIKVAFIVTIIWISIYSLNAAAILRNFYKDTKYPEPVKHFFIINKWLKYNTPQDSIILSRKPTITSLYSNRKAVVYPYTSDEQKIINYIESTNINYIIVDDLSLETSRYLLPALKKNEDRFEFVIRKGNTFLLQVKKRISFYRESEN